MFNFLTITQGDVINAAYNTFLINVPVMTGYTVALAINTLAHRFFDLKDGTRGSQAVKAVSFSIGVAVTGFIFSKMTISDFPIRKALELIITPLSPGALLGTLNSTGRMITILTLASMGALMGACREITSEES